ncbi:MAG: DUF1893 domain-containing protein [Firmicutes bacterium]|nr:DUF1893 domain-containing protein [Bacillota bacterium]
MQQKFVNKILTFATSLIVEKGGNVLYESSESGIKSALWLYKNKPEILNGASVYDKVIGKAVASIFIAGKASFIYGLTMSKSAVKLLEFHKISYVFGTLVPEIYNRARTALCPMEQLVFNAVSASDSVKLIEEKFND